MKMRSFVFATILMIGSLSIHVGQATDTFDTAYRETTFLMVEADLRLHLCHLKEFSLHLLQPSQASYRHRFTGASWADKANDPDRRRTCLT